MFKKFILVLSIFCSQLLFADFNPCEAIISSPVADLTVEPYYKSVKKGLSIEEFYQMQPFSGSWDACKRAHQLLFNERVTVLDEKGPEVKIKISNFYFFKANESIPSDTYWTLKKHVTYIKDIKQKKETLKKIPGPISYKDNDISSQNTANVITLKKPFYDPITKEIYSVGTRFVSVEGQNLKGPFRDGYFNSYIFDNTSQKIKTTQIPKTHCIRNYSKKPEDQIKNFVQVLRLWSYQKEGAIPYVLGGWSWTVSCPNDEYEIIKKPEGQYAIQRKKWAHSSKMGFDCMGLIGRAAQVCDIPFYIKNTTTLLKDLKDLKKGEKIEEGDIIWYPGHVMVISSIKKSLVIEARGYERGDGKVQENSVESIFENIKNLDELKSCFLEKKPITVLYADGRPWKTFKKFKILKFNSIFQKNNSLKGC